MDKNGLLWRETLIEISIRPASDIKRRWEKPQSQIPEKREGRGFELAAQRSVSLHQLNCRGREHNPAIGRLNGTNILKILIK